MASLSISFPIHPPRIHIGSFSFAIWMFVSICVVNGVLLWFVITSCLYVDVLSGRTVVFVMLNFAPEAMHYLSRVLKRFPMSSSCLRYTVVLSAKSVTIS